MKTYIYKNLSEEEISSLTQRNIDQKQEIRTATEEILKEVSLRGDEALYELSSRFDQVELDTLTLDQDDIEGAAYSVPRERQRALEIAFQNIHRFHSTQNRRERKIETVPGVECWREIRPIDKVGLYVPGGSAVLPSTLLMLGVPARIAGCKEIVVCSPPQPTGTISPYLAYVLNLLKIDKVHLVGGAQAIAAMAYGTKSIPKVDKIFGPGNQYVTMAKTLIQSSTNVAIDMPAGPSEVLILASEEAKASYISADLLAQAEHGPDSQSILVCTSVALIEKVKQEIQKQLQELPRAAIAQQALEHSYIVQVDSLEEGLEFSNLYAPEHLIIQSDRWREFVSRIQNAGSVFLGHLSPESAGDYASGTNHTLPTSSYAKSYSGVSVDSFVKKITFQHLNEEGVKHIGSTVEILAEIEGLDAHKKAMTLRMKDL